MNENLDRSIDNVGAEVEESFVNVENSAINDATSNVGNSNFASILRKFDAFFLPKEKKLFLILNSIQIISCFLPWIIYDVYGYKYNLFKLCLEEEVLFIFFIFFIMPCIVLFIRLCSKTSDRNRTVSTINLIISIIETLGVLAFANLLAGYGISFGSGILFYTLTSRGQLLYFVILLVSFYVNKRRR